MVRDRAGSSAAAAGGRAFRSHRRRGLVNGALVVISVALGAIALATSRPWLAAGAVVVAACRWWSRPDSDPGRWARGGEAEVATAARLARLPRRFVVLHDRHLPGSRGNLDHVVVGPSGAWVIDSKLRRARMRVRRGQVQAGEHVIDPGPAARQAAAVSRALGVPVTALIAVHGRGLRRRGKKVEGVRILPVERVVRRLKRGRAWTRAEVATVAARADRLLPPAGASE